MERTPEERKSLFAKWAQERSEYHQDKVRAVKKELFEAVKMDIDLDSMIDTIHSIIMNHGIRLYKNDIVETCNEYFNINKTSKQLLSSNVLYTNMDHANNMLGLY